MGLSHSFDLTLIAEGNESSLFRNCDNLATASWGDLLSCEDTDTISNSCAVVGARLDGSQYILANNASSASELAGICFSPDRQTIPLNIQYPGMTLAIAGD
ncbi:MAG: DUF839 domain-containing protein [Gammaproteobacteria bacterium]|nr:DUF839 domain-containing protein [Gammaproteobacteria bacterium]